MKYPENEQSIRLGKIRDAMAKDSLDALVVYGGVWKVEAIHYVSNLRVQDEDACVVIPFSGEPTLFMSSKWDLARAKKESWTKKIEVVPEHMMAAAGEEAAKYGKKIGVVGTEQMPHIYYSDLKGAAGGSELTNSTMLLNTVAMIKTQWELEIVRKCAKLADAGFLAEIECLHETANQYEIIAEIEYAMRKAGADENFQMIGTGIDLPSMNIATEKQLQAGDMVLSEISPYIGCASYTTQLCKTVKFGKASDVERDKYQMLCDALDYALNNLKTGSLAKDLCLWQNEIIGGAGYEKYCWPPYMRSRGHNFGLGTIELSADNEMLLEPNMVMVVHPNQYIPEIGYCACGDTIITTEDGSYERLSTVARYLVEVPLRT